MIKIIMVMILMFVLGVIVGIFVGRSLLVWAINDRRNDRERFSKYTDYHNAHAFEGPRFNFKGDAERTLNELNDLIRKYGQASLADIKDLSGITSNFRDCKYGWTSVIDGYIIEADKGYILNLPEAVLLG